MKEERMTEELAKIDGMQPQPRCWTYLNKHDGRIYTHSGLHETYKLPDYLHPAEGYVHMHRIIRKMGDTNDLNSTYHEFLHELDQILFNQHYNVAVDETFMASDFYLQATVLQLAEAIVKAYGKWEEA